MEGNLHFKIDWACLIVGRKFTIFALFYFVFEGNFQVQAPLGRLYSEGQCNGGFFALQVCGSSIWRGLYKEEQNFTVSQKPNLIIVLLYIVLKKITTNTLSQGT